MQPMFLSMTALCAGSVMGRGGRVGVADTTVEAMVSIHSERECRQVALSEDDAAIEAAKATIRVTATIAENVDE